MILAFDDWSAVAAELDADCTVFENSSVAGVRIVDEVNAPIVRKYLERCRQSEGLADPLQPRDEPAQTPRDQSDRVETTVCLHSSVVFTSSRQHPNRIGRPARIRDRCHDAWRSAQGTRNASPMLTSAAEGAQAATSCQRK
jgi:hypothetical protein